MTQASTTTTISYSPSNGHSVPDFYGNKVTISATVAVVAPGVGTPTGTVNFLDNAGATTLASSVTLTGGVATFSTTSLTAGNHTIVAVYSGDPNFITSNSTPTANTILVITPAVTATVAGFAGTVTTGTNATAATATSITVLALGGNLPNGASIKFGAVTVTLSAAATAGTTALHLTAPVGGTGIPGSTVSSSLLFSSNTQVYSQANVLITALVSSAVGSPTAGSVVFTDVLVTNASSSGTFQLGAKTTLTIGLVKVMSGGKAVLNESLNGGLVLPGVITAFFNNGQPGNISPLPNFIFAQYVNGLAGGSSDPNFFPSASPSSAALETISRTQTLTTVHASPTPSQFGLPVTITGTVTALGNPGVGGPLAPPIGTVTFTDSYTLGGVTTNTTLGTVNLNSLLKVTSIARSGTTATATVSGVLTSNVVGIYGASPTGFDGTFSPLNGLVITGPSTFTYTVSNTLPTLATGTITAAMLGTTSASATFTASNLAQANHVLRVLYNGDNTAPFPLPLTALENDLAWRGQWVPSNSLGYGEQVLADTTTGTLTATPAMKSPTTGSVTFVDSLTSTNGGSVHGGTVVFKDGTLVLGTSSVDIRGRATLVVSASVLTVGPNTNTITAVFNGNGNFKASTSGQLVYSIVGAPTVKLTGPLIQATTLAVTLTSTSVTVPDGVVSMVTGHVTTAGVNLTTLTNLGLTITGATPTAYDGSWAITVVDATHFQYTDVQFGAGSTPLPSPATGTIKALEEGIVGNGAAAAALGQSFSVTASVTGVPSTPPANGSPVVFVAESNFRDATAASGPFFTPFTLGTATLSSGIATLAMPGTGAASIGAEAAAAGDGNGADVYELEAFYQGDGVNYSAGHSASVTPSAGPRVFELSVEDTGVAFFNVKLASNPTAAYGAKAAGTIAISGRIRPSSEIGQLPPTTAPTNTFTPATGGCGGHIKAFIDGVQTEVGPVFGGGVFTTLPTTLTIGSTSGKFAFVPPAASGAHTVVLQYFGDGLDDYLPTGSTTMTFTQPLVAAGSNALASPKGSVVFGTAPKSGTGTIGSSTSSDTKFNGFERAVGFERGRAVLLHDDAQQHATDAGGRLGQGESWRGLADRPVLRGRVMSRDRTWVERGALGFKL